MSFDIILIEPNNLQSFDQYSDEFKECIKNVTKIETVTPDTFMDVVVKFIGMENIMGDTELCHEDEKFRVYQFCYVDDVEGRELNMLATQLSYKHRPIHGPVVLFGSKVTSKLCKNISMDYNDLGHLLDNKYFHTGVYVHNSGRMCEFTFHNDLNVLNERNQTEELMPRLHDIADLIKNGIYFEYSLMRYTLVIIGKKNDLDVNKPITLLIKKLKAKGNYIILHKISQNDYTNITVKELKKLVFLYDVDMLEEDTNIEKINGVDVCKNKYQIIYKKYKETGKKMNEYEKFVETEYSKIENNIDNGLTFDEEMYKEMKKQEKEENDVRDILKKDGIQVSENIVVNN